jgi:hypothetical protein
MMAVNVKLGNKTNKYMLFENAQNGTYIEAQFTDWNGDNATKLSVVKNTTNSFEILEARYINVSDCDGKMCVELHLKGTKGIPLNNNGKSYPILNECKFDCEISLIRYDFNDPIDKSLYSKELCSCEFESFETPEKAKGNILRGIR